MSEIIYPPAHIVLAEELQKFSRVRWSGEIVNKSANVFFIHYHCWELYDYKKEYGKNSFRCDYGWGTLTYEWVLYHTCEEGPSYAAVHEILSKEDRKAYAKFCTCEVCRSRFWKNLFSPHSRMELGCLKCDPSDFRFVFSQAIIDTSRSEIQSNADTSFMDIHRWLCGIINRGFEEVPQDDF